MSKFYNYLVSRVIYEMNRNKRLKHYMRIHNDVLTEGQVYEYLSRYSPEQYQTSASS